MKKRVQHVYMIGIGGTGMAGIAEVLLSEGYRVSGSDRNASSTIDRLKRLGANIALEHNAERLNAVDVVVVSTAIPQDNPEVVAAKEQKIPVISRAQMLAELMRFKEGIAVAGTHGKTTTTSLIASILGEAGLDPTYIIGGRLNSSGSNSRLGSGDYLVAEADESDASFLLLQPMLSVVTNIDLDHMSTYDNDPNRLLDVFLQFLHHLPFYGLAVVCADNDNVQALLPQIERPVKTYGLSNGVDYQAKNIVQTETRTSFQLIEQDTADVIDIQLNLPGEHNVLNALAACAIARDLDVEWPFIQKALAQFSGIARRFQNYGQLEFDQHSVMLVDDYGHHPAELMATLSAAQAGWPDKRRVLIFQPHRYSRTQDLFDDFVQALIHADLVILQDVYPAGETAIPGADSHALAKALRLRGRDQLVVVKDNAETLDVLQGLVMQDDLVLTMGAGNIGLLAPQLWQKFGVSE